MGRLATTTYRRDIDGLRALAIVPVVLFHAFPNYFRGGFIGVDIFFVISGYLISGILIQQLRQGRYSIRTFYAHRIRRIFPALIAVLLGTFALGWVLAMPADFMRIGLHMATGAGFMQNFNLLHEAGYFDVATETKPLMHLWSLAIEEQFYVVYPPLLWLLWRARHRLLISLIGLSIVSFIANLAWTHSDAKEAFFLPYPRMWELLSGGILATWCFERNALHAAQGSVPRSRLEDVLAGAGLACVVVGFTTITQQDHFPGWLALLPVCGAVLLLRSGPDAWVNRTLLSHPVAIWVGLISYPLYLWHWPLLSFLHITNSATAASCTMAAIASVALAWLTTQAIERPIRKRNTSVAMVATLSALMVFSAFLGFNTWRREGLPFRLNQKAAGQSANVEKIPYMKRACGIASQADAPLMAECWQDTRAPARFALFGDSKAKALAPGFLEASTAVRAWTFIGGTGSTQYPPVPVLSDAPEWREAQRPLRVALDALKAQHSVRVVVMTVATRALYKLPREHTLADLPSIPARFEATMEAGLNRVIDELIASKKKIVLTVDNPSLLDARRCVYRRPDFAQMRLTTVHLDGPGCSISPADQLAASKRYRDLLQRVQSRHPQQIRIFDPTELLCDMKHRVCTQTLDGLPLYSYTDHISNQASRRIAIAWMPSLIEFAENSAPEPAP